jgi:uncharacterized protein (TIGR01244 family)
MARLAALLPAALALALAACASQPAQRAQAPAPTAPAASAPGPGFVERSLARDNVLIGAQPAASDFEALRAAGVTRVFNLRTADEMATVGFDAAAAAAAAGMAYAQSPVGGAAGFTPAVLEAFAREMEAADGKLLLHCASGNRAGNLYAAWLVRYRGKSPDEAYREVAPLGLWPLPMERLLGAPLKVEFADPAVADSFEATTAR